MDEDDDDDRDDFTVGDVEAMDEGRGLLPPGSEGVGANVPLNDLLDLEDEQDDISGQGGATQFGVSVPCG